MNVLAKQERTGVMVAGLLGNNGSALYCALQKKSSSFWGSQLHHGSAVDSKGLVVNLQEVKDCLVPHDIVQVGGWDIDKDIRTLEQACARSQVVPLQDIQHLKANDPNFINPTFCLPGIWIDGFTGCSGEVRSDATVTSREGRGEEEEEEGGGGVSRDWRGVIARLVQNIDLFAEEHKLQHVVVVFSGSTERNVPENELNSTKEQYLNLVKDDTSQMVSPSQLYALAACQAHTKCTFINGAAQNTDVPGLVQLGDATDTLIIGNDLKTGQTSFKTAMGEFLITRGLKLSSIASFNTLSNNDGYVVGHGLPNIAKCRTKSSMTVAFQTFAPGVYDQDSNESEIKHLVRIEHFPAGNHPDNKKAIDHYLADTMFGHQFNMTSVTECPDTDLAIPVLFDLIMCSDMIRRHSFPFKSHHANVILSMLLKSPSTTCTISQFFSHQRNMLHGFLLHCIGRRSISREFEIMHGNITIK